MNIEHTQTHSKYIAILSMVNICCCCNFFSLFFISQFYKFNLRHSERNHQNILRLSYRQQYAYKIALVYSLLWELFKIEYYYSKLIVCRFVGNSPNANHIISDNRSNKEKDLSVCFFLVGFVLYWSMTRYYFGSWFFFGKGNQLLQYDIGINVFCLLLLL